MMVFNSWCLMRSLRKEMRSLMGRAGPPISPSPLHPTVNVEEEERERHGDRKGGKGTDE